jgi:hypothetical protein
MTISRINNSIVVFNTQQVEYEDEVERFIQEIKVVQDNNPINIQAYESEGGEFVYNALSEREKVLNNYNYTENMVPDKYINIHRQLVEFIAIYKEGINIIREGILYSNQARAKEDISKVITANTLLNKIRDDLILLKNSH